ncbi:LysR substrate-binding domain-containing protein [Pontiellaceae bacterium B1224]|nr:LysR substrate-binding domain-containing protein [Pontiellaceae bacterium B1224]
MNLQAFKYLLALNEHGGFNRAAEACNVSQPALSIQIKKFEDELGIQLLERGHKEFIFTPAGLEVLERARGIMRRVEEVDALSKVWNDPYSGELSVGAFPTLAPYYFPQILDHFIDAYPSLRINLVEEKTATLTERLKAGTLDCAFLAEPIEEDALEHGTIFSEEFYVGVPQGHPLGKRKTIDSAKVAKEKMLLLEEGHCLRGQALEYCSTAGMGDILNFRASSMETLLQMVEMGRAVSLIPDCVAKRNPQIHYVKLKGGGATRTIGLYWRCSSVRKDLMLELVDDLSREYAR